MARKFLSARLGLGLLPADIGRRIMERQIHINIGPQVGAARTPMHGRDVGRRAPDDFR